MYLKIKNAKPQKLMIACAFSAVIVVLFVMWLILSSISGEIDDGLLEVIFFCLIALIIIWGVYILLIFVFYKTIVVTEHIIKLCKRNKIVWEAKKEDILHCEYSRLFHNKNFYPEAGVMCFRKKDNGEYLSRKTKSGLIFENYIYLAYKDVKKIIELGYDVKIVSTN